MRVQRNSRAGRSSRSSIVASGGGGGTPASLNAAIESLSPIGYWKFDEASGNFLNSGSTGFSCGTVGAVTYRGAPGPDGGSYAEVGSGKYMTTNGGDYMISTPKTVCVAWYPTSNAGLNLLFAKGDADREYLFYDFSGTGEWQSTVYQENGTSAYRRFTATSVGAPALNQWHFAIILFDTAGDHKIRVDGTSVLPGTPIGPTGTVESGNPTMALTWGAWAAFPTAYYTVGGIAHGAVFEGLLSDSDATTLMSAAIAEGWTS